MRTILLLMTYLPLGTYLLRSAFKTGYNRRRNNIREFIYLKKYHVINKIVKLENEKASGKQNDFTFLDSKFNNLIPTNVLAIIVIISKISSISHLTH